MGFHSMIAYSLAAAVVGILAITIFSVSRTGQDAAISATQFQAAKESSLDVAAMIQRDFANIGSNHPNFDLPIDSVFVKIDTTGDDQTFSFRGQTTRGATPSLITYNWTQVGTESIGGETVPIYQLTRYIDGTNSGGNAGGIVSLKLRFEYDNGTAVANVLSTRRIRVDMELVSTLGVDSNMETSRWSAIIRPTALQIES